MRKFRTSGSNTRSLSGAAPRRWGCGASCQPPRLRWCSCAPAHRVRLPRRWCPGDDVGDNENVSGDEEDVNIARAHCGKTRRGRVARPPERATSRVGGARALHECRRPRRSERCGGAGCRRRRRRLRGGQDFNLPIAAAPHGGATGRGGRVHGRASRQGGADGRATW